MLFVNSINENYKKIGSLLEITALKYLKNDSRFKNLSITFHVREKAHIFMSHGCADKNYREIVNCRYLHNFNLILVPGPWLKNKLINLGICESKIACVGWPKLDPLFGLIKNENQEKELKTILWAPTHNNNNHHTGSISSYPKLNDYMEILNSVKGIEIIISEHPQNREEKEPTLSKLINCDYVITDGGSTIYEAWALKKPVIFPDWIVKENIIKNVKGSAEEYIYTNNIGYHANNNNELIYFLKSNLIIEKDVTEFMEEYMPSKFNGISGKVIYNEILKRIPITARRRNWYM